MSKRKLDASTGGRDFLIRSCTKDLRMRRVFSLGSDSKGTESVETKSAVFGSCEAAAAGSKDPVTDSEIKDASKDCEKDPNASGGTNKTGVLPKGILKKPNEDLIQTTPPDNVITRDTASANNCQNTLPKSRVRFAPSARQKLVQVRGSVSYRRLLPYLMKMDKDEVQALTEVQPSPNMDLQNSMLNENLDVSEIPVSNTPDLGKPEEITPPILVSMVAKSSEIPTAESIQSNSTNLPIEPQPPLIDSIAQSSEILTEENIQSNSTNLPIEPQQPLDDSIVQSSEIPTAENIQSNTTNLPNEPQPTLDFSIQAIEVLCSPQLTLCVSSIQETLTIDELASGNVDKSSEVITSTKMPEMRSDNTIKCQGGCMCLDCVLFRIRAEKSFEFSKKQLNEADEIIRGLVTEICSLRHIMEKSIGNSCNDYNQVYKDELIKMTCERASLTEKLATMQMKQMFTNLDAHCKPQERRVDFSDCINQKTIPLSPETEPREQS